jgi:hypothetical protein
VGPRREARREGQVPQDPGVSQDSCSEHGMTRVSCSLPFGDTAPTVGDLQQPRE